MTVTPRVTFPRVVREPGVQGGEPIIAGTRVPVRAIVVAWRECEDVAEVKAAYPRLSEDDVRQALAYYDTHRLEMDAIIRAQLAED